MICIEWIGMVRPRGLVRAAPPQLSFRPAGGALLGVDRGSLLDADQQPRSRLSYHDLFRIRTMVRFKAGDDEAVQAGPNDVRILLNSGAPINQPVA